MKKGDVLLKKWCFGVSYKKPQDWVEMAGDGAVTVQRYPRYRTIALQVTEAKKKGKKWEIEADQYASLNAKPKKVKLVLDALGNGAFKVPGQKKLYHRIEHRLVSEGMPPVGSLVTLNKKHALVCSVGRNEMTVFVKGVYKTVKVKPGTVRWREDKIVASIPRAA
jgi:hypothetical protein